MWKCTRSDSYSLQFGTFPLFAQFQCNAPHGEKFSRREQALPPRKKYFCEKTGCDRSLAVENF
jgi:hypothetical protein